MSGYHHSEETKKKIGKANRGKRRSIEARLKMSEAHKGKPTWNKGKSMSEETKRKMSLAATGRKFSEEYKRKLSKAYKGENNPFFGKKHSLETIEKIRKHNMKYPRRYWLGKKRLHMTGEKHFAWKGGIENHQKKNERNDPAYQKWVRLIKKRDNNECVFKGQNCFGYNIVHHILSWRDYPELRYEVKNGITLCQFHHPLKREDEQRFIPFFQEMVKSKELI